MLNDLNINNINYDHEPSDDELKMIEDELNIDDWKDINIFFYVNMLNIILLSIIPNNNKI